MQLAATCTVIQSMQLAATCTVIQSMQLAATCTVIQSMQLAATCTVIQSMQLAATCTVIQKPACIAKQLAISCAVAWTTGYTLYIMPEAHEGSVHYAYIVVCNV